MRATEHQRVGLMKTIREGLGEINTSDLFGDGVLHPSFFHQRNQQGTSLLPRLQPACFEGLAVSVAAVPITTILWFLVAARAASAPGSTTPITGTCAAAAIRSSASAVAVLHAMTSICAPCASR